MNGLRRSTKERFATSLTVLVAGGWLGAWVRGMILSGELSDDGRALWLSVFAGILVLWMTALIELFWSLHSVTVDRREVVATPDELKECQEHLELAVGYLSWWRRRSYQRELFERAERITRL